MGPGIDKSAITIALAAGAVFGLALSLSACDDTAKTASNGAQGATGVAEKMKGGTVGEASAEDTGSE